MVSKDTRIRMGLFLAATLIVAASGQSFAGAKTDYPTLENQELQIAASDDDIDEVNDPLEPLNRSIFGFNEFLQSNLLTPVAEVYNENLPENLRAGVRNFFGNLATPITVANQLLQGEPEEALLSVGRFLVNTVVGIGGIADVAGELGHPRAKEDFGQTLGVWGVNEGFYLVLPVFGPSNPRDAIGKFLVDPYFNAGNSLITDPDITAWDYSVIAVDGVSEYSGVVEELKQVRKTSVDYYAAIRSLYRQKRKSEISNGEQLELPPIPDLGYDFSPDTIGTSMAGAN